MKGIVWQCLLVIGMAVMLIACGEPTSQVERGQQLDLRLSEQELKLRQHSAARDSKVYHFGFDLRASPQEDARQYLPFLKYLERTTGYDFELRFTASDEDIVSNLGTGEVDFAAIGAVSFIKAQRRFNTIGLVRGVNALGKSTYRSCIVVRRDSPIKHIKDLRRQHFAFGSRSSTQGYLIPRIVLQQHGIMLEDLAGYRFTGSHQKCVDEIVAQKSEACGLQDTLAERLAAQDIVRILHRSDDYPSSGIAANHMLPDEVVANVKAALLAFDPTGADAEGLYAWERTEMPKGFEEMQPEDYHELEGWIDKFKLSGEI